MNGYADVKQEKPLHVGRISPGTQQQLPASSAIPDHRPDTIAQRKLQTAIASSQPVLQAVWLFVEETGRARKYNLTTNTDGTYTHTKTGVTYKDAGKKTSGGETLLTPVNAVTPVVTPTLTTSIVHDPKNVLFDINQYGKVNYLGNTVTNRQNFTGRYLEMDPANFAVFKNGGKRSGSNKVMDPVTLTKYHYDGTNFFTWNKDKLDGKGNQVSKTAPFGQQKSEHEILAEKLKNGELVDRRRQDRSKKDLSPFDVGPYKSHVTMSKESNPKLSRTYEKLTGIEAWTSKPSDTNRDHVPSGESLRERGGGNEAYNTGFTIAIPNKLMHQPFSPTFGTDNSHKSGMNDVRPDGKEQKRVLFDSENPATAFFKDTSYMLDKTSEQDYSSSHKSLDLTQGVNRARQVGAYRHMFRRNVRMNTLKGKKFGINPLDSGRNFTVSKRIFKKKPKKATVREGAFRYTDVLNMTQGEIIAKMFRKNLLNKKLARKLKK